MSHRDVGHNVQVMQRVTDGYELVIGHHDQEETIQTPKKHKKGHLCQASCIGDDPSVSLNVQNHFQDCGGGEIDVSQGWKKYMEVWRWGSDVTARMMSRFPSTVTRYVDRNRIKSKG